jgi:hypothetical protein
MSEPQPKEFTPEEIIFCPTGVCNLRCDHCSVARPAATLDIPQARIFLQNAKKQGVKRLGFSGGEPFLARPFLAALSAAAIDEDLLFDRIMTNGAWFHDQTELDSGLAELYESGYDGTLCISVDAFHPSGNDKVAQFILAASEFWNWPGAMSLAAVRGSRDQETEARLLALAKLLGTKVRRRNRAIYALENDELVIPVERIDFSPVGELAASHDPWSDTAWFLDDYCEGPGHVLYVFPDGRVSACCGYANEEKNLIIGNIAVDPVETLLANARQNRFVRAIYETGLARIRQRLEKAGVSFPGQTLGHCYFCWYIQNHLAPEVLIGCLDSLR